jgi:hypothetical protein
MLLHAQHQQQRRHDTRQNGIDHGDAQRNNTSSRHSSIVRPYVGCCFYCYHGCRFAECRGATAATAIATTTATTRKNGCTKIFLIFLKNDFLVKEKKEISGF